MFVVVATKNTKEQTCKHKGVLSNSICIKENHVRHRTKKFKGCERNEKLEQKLLYIFNNTIKGKEKCYEIDVTLPSEENT